jgi:hypothetical protein
MSRKSRSAPRFRRNTPTHHRTKRATAVGAARARGVRQRRWADPLPRWLGGYSAGGGQHSSGLRRWYPGATDSTNRMRSCGHHAITFHMSISIPAMQYALLCLCAHPVVGCM